MLLIHFLIFQKVSSLFSGIVFSSTVQQKNIWECVVVTLIRGEGTSIVSRSKDAKHLAHQGTVSPKMATVVELRNPALDGTKASPKPLRF